MTTIAGHPCQFPPLQCLLPRVGYGRDATLSGPANERPSKARRRRTLPETEAGVRRLGSSGAVVQRARAKMIPENPNSPEEAKVSFAAGCHPRSGRRQKNEGAATQSGTMARRGTLAVQQALLGQAWRAGFASIPSAKAEVACVTCTVFSIHWPVPETLSPPLPFKQHTP